jgi:hypothetical protein
VRPGETNRAKTLDTKLQNYTKEVRPLPGIEEESHRKALVEQIIESIRRIEFVHVINKRKLSPKRTDPSSNLFDPLKAAVIRAREKNVEEAYWLVFIYVHFGKHRRAAWRLARDVYGGLDRTPWTWAVVSSDPEKFAKWLKTNEVNLRAHGGMFGGHRHYETLKASSSRGLPAVAESYIKWVKAANSHQELFAKALANAGGDPNKAFLELYKSMKSVISFGRLARFDYLTMVSKLGLAGIEPGSAFIAGATGPLTGGRLLFGGSLAADIKVKELDREIRSLGDYLNVGMQVMEDAICNWQKSPSKFKPFRG